MTIPTDPQQIWPPIGGQSSTSGDGMMPTLITSGDVFTVPANRQGLSAMPVDVEGWLIIDGYFIEVN
jgi:hypothetical protein